MLNHLRRLVKHSVVYGLAETVSRGTGFLLVFFYGYVLSREAIGLRGAIYSAATFISLLYTLGLDNAFMRFFMDREYRRRREAIFSTVTVVSAAIGCVMLVVASLWGDAISALLTKGEADVTIIHILFFIMIFDTIVIYPMLVLRAENRLGYFSLVSFLRFFLFLVLNVVLVWYLDRGLRGVFESNLIVVVIVALALVPVYRQYMRFQVSGAVLRTLLAFGVPTIFTLLCMRVVDYADRQMILHVLGSDGSARLGDYNMAYTPGMVGVMVFINSFRLAWQPFFLSLKDNPENKGVFARVATWYAVLIGYVLVGITLFRREIFMIYAPKFPVELSSIIPVVSLAYALFGFYIIMNAGVFITKKTMYLPIVTFFGAAVNIGLNFLFIPRFGIIGAAYTTVLSYSVVVGVMYLVSSRLYHISYDFRRIGIAVIFTIVPVLLSVFLSPSSLLLDFLWRVILVIAVPAMYLSSRFLLPDERDYLKRFLNRRFGKTE